MDASTLVYTSRIFLVVVVLGSEDGEKRAHWTHILEAELKSLSLGGLDVWFTLSPEGAAVSFGAGSKDTR